MRVMSILQRLTGPNIFLLIPGCCYILLLHTAIMGCYLLLFLLLSLQHHKGTCCNRNHAVYGKCGFILNAHGNYSWCHLGAAERRRACVTYEWAGSLRRLNDHSGWGGVRWGDGDMGEWTGCVCRVSLLLCVKGCWCSSRRSHTVPHTAGMGCYNVTHGEDPHLTLCQHCGEASHTHICTHMHDTHCVTCSRFCRCENNICFSVRFVCLSVGLTCLAFCTRASICPGLFPPRCISLRANLPAKTGSEHEWGSDTYVSCVVVFIIWEMYNTARQCFTLLIRSLCVWVSCAWRKTEYLFDSS